MKQVTLHIPENKYAFFMKLVHSLNFVKVADNEIQEEKYNPEFVAKIEKSSKDYKEGNYIRVEKDDLKHFLGL